MNVLLFFLSFISEMEKNAMDRIPGRILGFCYLDRVTFAGFIHTGPGDSRVKFQGNSINYLGRVSLAIGKVNGTITGYDFFSPWFIFIRI